MLLIRKATILSFAAAAASSAQNPTAIEHHLRYGVRVADQPDVALELVDRMKSYHVPGLSLAVIDNYRVVFAKGYGVRRTQGGRHDHAVSRGIDKQTGVRKRLSASRRRSEDLARR